MAQRVRHGVSGPAVLAGALTAAAVFMPWKIDSTKLAKAPVPVVRLAEPKAGVIWGGSSDAMGGKPGAKTDSVSLVNNPEFRALLKAQAHMKAAQVFLDGAKIKFRGQNVNFQLNGEDYLTLINHYGAAGRGFEEAGRFESALGAYRLQRKRCSDAAFNLIRVPGINITEVYKSADDKVIELYPKAKQQRQEREKAHPKKVKNSRLPAEERATSESYQSVYP